MSGAIGEDSNLESEHIVSDIPRGRSLLICSEVCRSVVVQIPCFGRPATGSRPQPGSTPHFARDHFRTIHRFHSRTETYREHAETLNTTASSHSFTRSPCLDIVAVSKNAGRGWMEYLGVLLVGKSPKNLRCFRSHLYNRASLVTWRTQEAG